MRAVFVHRHYPGQFGHLARHLAEHGWHVSFVCETADSQPSHVRILRYMAPSLRRSGVHRHLAVPDQHVRIGEQVAAALDTLRKQEGPPSIVIGHIGWGGLLFAKDVLPTTPMLGYCEFYYRAEGSDVGFSPEDEVTLDERMRLRMRNTAQDVTLAAIEAGISPTRWQRAQYPSHLRKRIAVGHEGVDVELCVPRRDASLALPGGVVIRRGDPVVTFVSRDLEPYRGFPQFMRAAAKVIERHPTALVVVVGGDGVSYGRARSDGRCWREVMMQETGIDPARIVFLGRVPHPVLITLLQISAVHVYLTYPFVLSWSLLEAMACGCVIVGSATAPVQEVIRHGVNGLLVDFFDEEELAKMILGPLRQPARVEAMRAKARRTVETQFALRPCIDRQLRILNRVMSGPI